MLRLSSWMVLGLTTILICACTIHSAPSDSQVSAAIPDKIDYNLHIKPILSDRCFACHGPDEEAREAELRLDTKEGLFSRIDNQYEVVVPGKASKSELYRRIINSDSDEQMPPPESNLALTSAEIALIEAWIDQGAEWKPHWAYIPPQKPQLPPLEDESWPKNEIDYFILNQLEQAGLKPTEEADKESLIRRLSFDLTGLPPSVEEIDIFQNDTLPGAYERLVDRLMASEHYGEHMALDWLDVARYADTHGYQADYYRPHWPWRDWVIEAMNDNMPYDAFVSWQLAGDMFDLPSKEQILATGFNRNHAQNAEGGIVQEEYRVEYVADRTQTFATAFMGLTMQCARCHDHKYDPVSQQEYYELFSFFNQVDESGQITWNFSDMPGPTMHLTDRETEKQLIWLKRELEKEDKKVDAYHSKKYPAFEKWLKEDLPPSSQEIPKGLVASFPLDDMRKDHIPNEVTPTLAGKVINPVTNRLTEDQLKKVAGVSLQPESAVLLNGDDALDFPGVGRFGRADAFSVGMWVNIPEDLKSGVIFHSNKGAALYTFKGYQLSVENDHFDLRLAHDFPHNAIQLLSKDSVVRNEWIHLMITYDGSSKASGARLYVNGKAQIMEIVHDNLKKDIIFHPTHEGGGYIKTELKVGGRWRSKGFASGKVDEIVVFDRQLTAPEVSLLVGKYYFQSIDKHAISQKQQSELFEYYLQFEDSDYVEVTRRRDSLRQEEVRFVERLSEVMVMDERPKKRPTYLLSRGAYDAPSEEVFPATPRVLFAFDQKYEQDRRGLAKWLFDPQNPLTARVTVNRYWQRIFGRGIVRTSEDFGSQGDLPSHPALLDWLAVSFRESGWDVKQLIKMMVISATYRQAASADAETLERDPDNLLLSRTPRMRLGAESLRDQALKASGLLVPKIGGPPVKPYQPDGIWDVNAMSGKYDQSHGEDLYRRSMYTFWKRTIPPPSMNTFDAPYRAECTVRRQKTTTPLQALVLMNDPQFVEAARMLGERMMKEVDGSASDRIIFAFRSLTGKWPSEKELTVLREQYKAAVQKFGAQPEKAEGLLNTGEYVRDVQLAENELAACALVATTIMNLDASMMK